MTALARLFPNGEWRLILAVVAEIALFAVVAPNFLTVGNFFEVTRLSVELGLLAVALTPVIVGGGIDLSVGAMLGLSAVVFGAAHKDFGLSIPARRGLGGDRRCGGRRAQRPAHRPPRDSAAHRHAGIPLALSWHCGRHHARGYELHRLPTKLPGARARLSRRRHSRAAAAVRPGCRGIRHTAAPLDHRPRAVCHRVLAGRRALCRDSGPAPGRPRLPALGRRLEPRCDRLCRASRSGEVGRRERVRARCDHGRRTGRNVRVRRPRHALGHAARPLRHLHSAQRAPACGAPVGAGGRAHRNAAPRDDRHRPPASGGAVVHRVLFGGRSEEQSGCRPLRHDRGRFADRRQHERLAGAIAPADCESLDRAPERPPHRGRAAADQSSR